MNVHHLELFYYVAEFGGITAAVRKMPYGIQQPAVSGQILQLERELGVTLFNRRPFALTPAGEELFDFCRPFFAGLEDVEARLKGEESQHLRLAASAVALTHHLPRLLDRLRRQFPDLKLTLKDAVPSSVEDLLNRQEIDLAISVLHGDEASGIHAIELLKLPLALVVPDSVKARSFERLLIEDSGRKTVAHSLVGLPPNEAMVQIFQKELARRGIVWEPRVEVNSLELVESYVRGGFGIGLSVEVPGMKPGGGVRRIRLKGFPPVRVGLLYRGQLKPVAARFAEEAKKRAKDLV